MPRDAAITQARSLRRRAPVTERQLWTLLRDRRLADLKFRRQVPMGPYVLDFVCFQHRLIVEADGPFHDPEHDARRDQWLAANGFRVLRLSNREATSPQALDRILEAAAAPTPTLPSDKRLARTPRANPLIRTLRAPLLPPGEKGLVRKADGSTWT